MVICETKCYGSVSSCISSCTKKIPEDIIPNRDRKGDEKAKKSIRFSDLK